MNEAPINEIVALLSARAPSDLAALQSKYPAIIEIARPGMVLGKTSGYLIERAHFALQGLRVIIRDCKTAVDSSRSRLKRSWNLRLAGDICALVGSSSVLGFAGAGHEGGSLVSGVVAFVGALTSLLAGSQEKLVGKEAGSIEDLYNRLYVASWRAEQLMRECETLVKYVSSNGNAEDVDKARERLEEVITESNAFCAEVIHDIAPLLIPATTDG